MPMMGTVRKHIPSSDSLWWDAAILLLLVLILVVVMLCREKVDATDVCAICAVTAAKVVKRISAPRRCRKDVDSCPFHTEGDSKCDLSCS